MAKEPEEKVWCLKPSNSVQQNLTATSDQNLADQQGEREAEEDAGYGDDIPWDEDEFANIPEPPDGGWGWVIVAASFLCNMVVDGIAYTFGIFFMEFVQYYQAPKGKTAWVGSLLSGCYLSAGPVVSALTNRFGCRPVTMVGSAIATVAFLLSTMAPNVNILMITYGIMGGIGFGLIYLPAIVSVGYYFSTKRAFATGIAVCGSGMGAFVFAPVCQKLLEIYDWKGALMILAGLSLNCMVFGSLMRPLEALESPQTKPLLQRIAEEKELQRLDSLCDSQFHLIQHADGTMEKRPKSMLNLEPGVHSTLYLDQLLGKSPADTPVITLSPIEEVRKSPVNSKEEEEEEEVKPPDIVLNPMDTIPHQPSNLVLLNGHAPHPLPPSAIQAIAKRKGLLSINGTLKMSVSNITVNNSSRKNSVTMSGITLSSSGIIYSNSRNNNYLVEEVWKQLQEEEEELPLDGKKMKTKNVDKKDYTRPLYRKDIFYSGSIANLPEFKQSQNDVRSYVASVISIPRDHATSTVPPVAESKPNREYCPTCLQLPKSMSDTLSEILDFSLLKNSTFLLICISNIFGMMGFYIPFVYVTDSTIMKGVPADQAAFLISIIGITNTIGRLIFGCVADRPGVSAFRVYNVCLTLSGLCTFVFPFCRTYATIVADCTLFGLFVSAYISLTSIILVELLGLDKLTNAFGLLSLFRGASSIVGPPVAGSLFDLTGSYDLPFFISGAMLVLAAILSFMVPCCTARCGNTDFQEADATGEGQDDLPEVLSVDQVETVV